MYDKRDSKDKNEDAREFLRKTSRERWLMTLTRIRHFPRGKDEIIHNFGTLVDPHKMEADFVGPDGLIKDTNAPYAGLLGTSDSVSQIDNVFKWLNGTSAYIYRLNEKPRKVDERVARFGADSGGADLSCDGYPSYGGESLGVRLSG